MANLKIEGNATDGCIANFRVTYDSEDGEIIVRDMFVSDVCKLLDGHSHDTSKGFDLELPYELLADGIERYRVHVNTDGEVEYFTFVKILPPEKTGFLLYSRIPVVIPQPRRLILYSSNGEIRIFALKGSGKLKANTPLYWYPLGHVQRNGDVCKGNCVMRAKNLKEASGRINDFFIAGTEGHYYHPGETIKEAMSFGDMMNRLQETDKFPEEWLIPASDWYHGEKGSLTFYDVW